MPEVKTRPRRRREDKMLDEQTRLAAAIPEGWYGGMLWRTRHFEPLPGMPAETVEVEFYWGTPIEGGKTVYYGDVTKTGIQKTHKRVTVKAIGATVDDLIAVAERLRDLEKIVGLRWPIEFSVEAHNFPD
jgi:hypothetical protein